MILSLGPTHYPFSAGLLAGLVVRGSAADAIIRGIIHGDITLATCESIEAEYLALPDHPGVQSLLDRHGVEPSELRYRIGRLLVYAEVVGLRGEAPQLERDPADAMFIHCALSADVECVVTSDKDFSDAPDFGVEFWTAAEFVQRCRRLRCCDVDRWA